MGLPEDIQGILEDYASLGELGNTIYIYAPATQAFTSRGDASTSWSSPSSTSAIVLPLDERTLMRLAEGEAVRGGARAYIKVTDTIDIGYKVTYNSVDYEVIKVDVPKIQNTQLMRQCVLTKINSY